MRRNMGWDNQDSGQCELRLNCRHGLQMTEVDGIEGAAKHAHHWSIRDRESPQRFRIERCRHR